MKVVNIFSKIPSAITTEILETIITTDELEIERIISQGNMSPEGFWYNQPRNEWVIVLQGRARLKFRESGEVIELNPGDYVNIPRHVEHRVEWTDPARETVWLAVHYG